MPDLTPQQAHEFPSATAAGTCALMRTTRFEVAPHGMTHPGSNSFSASPVCAGLGGYFEATLRILGDLQPESGMVENIHRMDTLVRSRLAPLLGSALSDPASTPGGVLRTFAEMLGPSDPAIESVELRLNPHCRVRLQTSAMSEVLLCHRYQFAASHRLHNPELDDAANAALFGKCSRPSGHGHNYWIEVDVVAPIDGPFTRHVMDAIVDEIIVERFDHRNLNTDCPEFEDRLPTVEHITMVCHDLLQSRISEAGGRLRQVRVWETEKTWSAYPVEPAR